MARRIYTQSLVDKATDLQKYMTRYRTKAFTNLATEQRTLYDSTVIALDAMLLAIKKTPVQPDAS